MTRRPPLPSSCSSPSLSLSPSFTFTFTFIFTLTIAIAPPHLSHRRCRLDVAEAPSITEGFERLGKHGRAFVVRGTSDLTFDLREFSQAAREQDTHGEACTTRFERVLDVRLARCARRHLACAPS